MTENDFVPLINAEGKKGGKVTWQAPSNIALVKYWGKLKNQIPANPSLSFTLDTCVTTTSVSYTKLKNPRNDFSFDFLFEGKPKPDFEPKIKLFFSRIEPYSPFLKDYHLVITTSNSFPHSSGIASSASGMAALSLCIMAMEREFYPDMEPEYFTKKASFLSRLGSGSACRSIQGGVIHWGQHQEILGSSDRYAIPYPFLIHKVFADYQDTILLVDKGQKQVSSSLGHDLMLNHPYAKSRFLQAHENITRLQAVFKDGNLDKFIEIVESEALTLHAMMMTANPYFMLMRPHTLEIISRIWTFRKATRTPVCFTLDAGANVHLLYPKKNQNEILYFITNELVAYCENEQYICDQIGFGAKEILSKDV
ncbi:diphosphomevalonate decarboxylase [Arenibacter sp. GZD96]|uniref:diphosphomevalonate/mevalonate 3,5-bisphosphate decarboxylase family protein n=1 Tax=Aurantibrevibacter litoralis TaxID=3106030 RepID=UPI002AFE708D|nr:hypothetical protein [Arenibacter sp. GZD-96]MEA1785557.1 diphosphomevalonate decarboxylase [Arenibacter sp. GZD-96]